MTTDGCRATIGSTISARDRLVRRVARLVVLIIGFSMSPVGAMGAVATTTPSMSFAVTDLGVLPGQSGSKAFGVNDRGDVVGESQSNVANQATMFVDGKVIDLAHGSASSRALAVNRAGDAVGDATPGYAALYADGMVRDLGVLPAPGSTTSS